MNIFRKFFVFDGPEKIPSLFNFVFLHQPLVSSQSSRSKGTSFSSRFSAPEVRHSRAFSFEFHRVFLSLSAPNEPRRSRELLAARRTSNDSILRGNSSRFSLLYIFFFFLLLFPFFGKRDIFDEKWISLSLSLSLSPFFIVRSLIKSSDARSNYRYEIFSYMFDSFRGCGARVSRNFPPL